MWDGDHRWRGKTQGQVGSSEPTVWDGDFAYVGHSYLRTCVLSPPCGMATVYKLLLGEIDEYRSEPTVWDGDLSFFNEEKRLDGEF